MMQKLDDYVMVVVVVVVQWIRRVFGLRGLFSPSGALLDHSDSGLGGFLDLGAFFPPQGHF